ncbi:MAG: GNAT family N-acetyltransferase [Acidobacteria bacterium]|nr:GNAT family N-acetyltransferase [Acidobacteriota bacterium]
MSDAARLNDLGQPIGEALPGWTPPPMPPHTTMTGRLSALSPLVPADATRLWEAFGLDSEGRNWTYLSQDPYEHYEDFAEWVRGASASVDPQFYSVRVQGAGGQGAPPVSSAASSLSASSASGVASYLRIAPAMGTIEVGHIHFSPLLQHTPAATEAMFLMMQRVFELGYRRYEWKCDALNAPSRRAAQRLGFSFEGIFRQALVVKGRNRDTAWYACIDREWPSLRAAYERWLDPANFDEQGRQRVSLSSLTAPILASRG